MTVRGVCEDGMVCQWFSKSETLKKDVFPDFMLMPADDVGGFTVIIDSDADKL
ncbi:hypothetical protein BC777_1126 [Yoonia maricola]|uniref:Uncharacterized protein n=2 Tax=Yoonia maricola TaxID=420999 RepID=A0A2M8WMX7_9RHOB|nr:hypothetical protein BC777_1126 [Yoonia maricola]